MNYVVCAVCILIAILNVIFIKNKKANFIIAVLAIAAAIILEKFI